MRLQAIGLESSKRLVWVCQFLASLRQSTPSLRRLLAAGVGTRRRAANFGVEIDPQAGEGSDGDVANRHQDIRGTQQDRGNSEHQLLGSWHLITSLWRVRARRRVRHRVIYDPRTQGHDHDHD